MALNVTAIVDKAVVVAFADPECPGPSSASEPVHRKFRHLSSIAGHHSARGCSRLNGAYCVEAWLNTRAS